MREDENIFLVSVKVSLDLNRANPTFIFWFG